MSGRAGYSHPAYAAALAEWGAPVRLAAAGGSLLARPIAGPAQDAINPYPLLACADWNALAADLDSLGKRYVSVVAVIDPLFGPDPDRLAEAFTVVRPFKRHVVVESGGRWSEGVSRHHRAMVRRALRDLRVERVEEPASEAATFTRLYGHLIDRHRLTGIQAFSSGSLEAQLAVPGAVLYIARLAGVAVGAQLWYVSGDAAYSHLQAASDAGYRTMAAYALYWTALDDLAPHVSIFDLGGAPGADDAVGHGLTFFKDGWSETRRTASLVARIPDVARYDSLVRASGAPPGTTWLPAYRAPGSAS